MADIINFDDLIDKGSFDKGSDFIVSKLRLITEEIERAKQGADEFAKVVGLQLKKEIQQLSASSKNLAKDMANMEAKMNQFKAATSNTKKVISDYEKENKKLNVELEKLKKQLEENTRAQVNNTTASKQATSTTKNLAQSFIGLAGGAALVHRGITILSDQLKLAVKSTIEFEQKMKEVQAISRGSAEQLASLTANANKLGASTEKTAVQVADLQKELAKLGFTTTEILAASEAIVDLSTATGEDLAGSATVVASTLRAFGLEATETRRVVDVMAGSFVRSGLDLEKFRESIKLVAPIARATGIDIETTTAALSKLADAGLSGSLAGTALRNLLSEMADPTSKLSEFLGYTVDNSEELIVAFTDLRNRGVDLAQAVQMVDVRARPAFFTLMNQVDAVGALSKEYRSLTGESERIATLMRDTLANDIEIADSAFDAMRRNLVDNNTPAMREFTQTLTKLIEGIRLLSDGKLETDNIIVKMFQYDWMMKGKAIRFVGDGFAFLSDQLAELGINVGGIFQDIDESLEKQRIAELTDEMSGSIKVFQESVQMVDLNGLLDEYNKLASITEKTADDTNRMAQIEYKLAQAFGESAYAVEKGTGELFLNTEAIERSIISKTKEAQTTRESIKARVDEIDSKITLNAATITTTKLTGTHSEAVGKEITLLLENKKLLGDKAILLRALSEEYGTLVDTGVNGWSVLTQAGRENLKVVEDVEGSTKEAFDALAKLQKQKIDDQILAVKSTEEEKELIDRLRKENKDWVEEDIEGVQKKIDARQKFKDTQLKIGQDLNKLEKELFAADEKTAEKHFDTLKEFDEKAAKDELDLEKETWQKKQFIIQEAANAMQNITRSVFDNRQILRDQEMLEIQEWEERALQAAGDNERAKAEIREEAAERERELKIKQAKDNKAEAMFQIAIDTARAVMATLGQTGFFGIPMSVIVGALGAAQLAAVATRPIPKFEKGTYDSPEGIAEVAERGRELIVDGRTNQVRVAEGRQYTHLSKGSIVVPNKQTEELLKGTNNIDHNSMAYEALMRITKSSKENSIDYSKMKNAFVEGAKQIPQSVTNFDEEGVRNYIVTRTARVERLNKRRRY